MLVPVRGCYNGIVMGRLEGTEKSQAHSPEVGAPGASPSPMTPSVLGPLLKSSLQGIPALLPISCHMLTPKASRLFYCWRHPNLELDVPQAPNFSPSPPNLLLPTGTHLREMPNLEGLIGPTTVTAQRSPSITPHPSSSPTLPPRPLTTASQT